MNPIVRFAPSPTGDLHIGGVRTALFNFLFARKYNGKFLLRIEDTDTQRSKESYTSQILDSLSWLGFNYDDNVIIQSSRFDRYNEIIKKLVDSNLAYYCFLSEADLNELRAKDSFFLYPGTWRDRSNSEVNSQLEKNVPYTIRLKIPQNEKIKFDDLVYGRIETNTKELDDFIIQRSDGNPTYNFTVVVDDYDMKISHVIRGEDHISNTPKQILIYNSLDWKIPKFAHLPMILGLDGRRLSKRYGATGAQDYQKLGYLPEALINYLSLLGWNPGSEQEFFELESLLNEFSLNQVNKKSAVFDAKKLDWLNGQHLEKKPLAEILDLIKELNPEWGSNKNSEYLFMVIKAMNQRSKTLKEIINGSKYYFEDPLFYDKKALEKCLSDDSRQLCSLFLSKFLLQVEWHKGNLNQTIDDFSKEQNIDKIGLIKLLRVALTGSLIGPSIIELMIILGKDICLKRLNSLINFLDNYE